MLREKGLSLDGVVELKVDEGILIRRIESRIRETLARGEPLRKDDDPEILKTRLEAYRRQTAPLIDYYRDKGMLRGVDGMAPIDEVTAAIDWIFQKPAAPTKTSAKPANHQEKTREIGPEGGEGQPRTRPRRPQGQEGRRETGRQGGPRRPGRKPAKKAAKKPAKKAPKSPPGARPRKPRNAVNSGARRG